MTRIEIIAIGIYALLGGLLLTNVIQLIEMLRLIDAVGK
jgi:hypothetical protein